MQKLIDRLAEHLKPLQAEISGYQFKYTELNNDVIVEIVEQNPVHSNFVPISTRLFWQKDDGDKTMFYIRVLQATETSFDRLKEIFSMIENSLEEAGLYSCRSKGL